ncbi:MAG TPA: hypothetical protein VKK31_00195 [Thermoanaerobaculia bacterium]|nr:hypothetical protein [Thermoanaerobaculia bacterium]
MSFDVLVVPEDPANNGYILKPLISRMLAECGKANARVTVLSNPRTKGYEHAKALLRNQLFLRYRHMKLILFLPDADGKNREGEFQALEDEANRQGVRLLCCAAKEEVEVWLLAGYRDKLEQRWQDVRSDTSVKENVFQPFLAAYGNPKAPGGGRDLLMAKMLSSYGALLQLCPELAELERRIREILS